MNPPKDQLGGARKIIPIKPVPAPSTEACCAPAPSSRRMLALTVAALLLWALAYSQLERFADWFSFDVLLLKPQTHLGEAVRFFIYDTPKVLMLLTLVVFCMGVLHTFFAPQRTRALLAGKRTIFGNISAASLGIVTPFCSCSAVPLFIGFLTAGVPLGVTFSFLIAAPMVNEVALALLFGLFGWKVAGAYLILGLSVAIIAGYVIGLLKLENWVEPWVYQIAAQAGEDEAAPNWNTRLLAGVGYVKEIVGKVWPYLVGGILIGAVIHGYVPENALAAIMGKDAWWSVPLAVLIGVPMYSNAAGMIPVVQALLAKGAALGTVLAFMMSVIALSLPEMIILRKVLSVRLIAVFASIVAVGILLVGYIFNALF